jgi:hypothetical protein
MWERPKLLYMRPHTAIYASSYCYIQVVWERAGAYCHIDALVASDSLLKLCSLTASLALPLGLTYAHELPADSASSSTPRPAAASSASAAALYLGEEEEEDSSRVSFMTPGAEGLAEVARILLGCGWGKRGTRMPTYEEMRRYAARKAAYMLTYADVC